MKRSSGPHKTASNLSEPFQQHLNMYAIAAGAAGVGVLACVLPTEAKIVYTPTRHTLTNGTLPIPLDNTHDFTLSDKFYIITGSWSTQLLNINVAATRSRIAL